MTPNRDHPTFHTPHYIPGVLGGVPLGEGVAEAGAGATFGHLAFYTTLSALALSGVMPFG